MKFNRPLYYCTECKLVVPTLDRLLFIEDNSSKGFCSEACIEDFYLPIIKHFEVLESRIRIRLNIENEKITFNIDEKKMVDEVLGSPSEVLTLRNELNEEIFTYIKHFENFSSIVICTVYKGEGSFIFLSTQTKSREFLRELRDGNKSSSEALPPSGSDEFNMDEEDFNFMQLLEFKKSKLLAELLAQRKDSDISFENFNEYEFCFQECLDSPDEIFDFKDNEGDSFFVYIKSFIKDSSDFFYIISCLKRKGSEEDDSVSVFPVLAFPTNDVDLYSSWRTGKKIAGHIKN
ncbi:MAG: hypothetical protein WC635_14865 [Bacteriovorax sp.]|jgi:hypothetical protein